MTKRPLAPLEKYTGILVPDCVQEFFRNPKELSTGWIPYAVEEINSLKHLYPNHPLGHIPLFRDPGGNALCLYYGKGAEPLIAGFDMEQGWITPLDDVVEDFFAAPERYQDDDRRWFKQGKPNLPEWDSLNIEIRGPGMSQLLKPWNVLQNANLVQNEFHGCDHHIKRSCLFNSVTSGLAGEANENRRAEYYSKRFSDKRDLADWFLWYRLGCGLATRKRPKEAIAILSNALFIALSSGPLWSKMLLIAQKLQEILASSGPLLYRRQVERWMPTLETWVADE